MSVSVDLRVVELLCSRICHDLISPVTAINNGVELWNDMGAEVLDDALGLISLSADQAKRKLLFLRLALGAAGAESGGEPARDAAQGFFAGTKIDLDWQDTGMVDALPRGGAKLVLNVVLIASECIGSGGRIRVAQNGAGIVVTATSKNAAFRPGVAEALAGAPVGGEIEPRSAHAILTKSLADSFGISVHVMQTPPDRIDFRIAQR